LKVAAPSRRWLEKAESGLPAFRNPGAVGDEILDFRPINIVVDLLISELLRVEHHRACAFIHSNIAASPASPDLPRQAIGNRFNDSFESGKLL
jgi:hypothetical protein